MKLVGFILLMIGSAVLTWNDLGVDTWQYWAIYLPLVFGGSLTLNEEN